MINKTTPIPVQQDDQAVPLLEMRGITKRFPGVVALDQVDFKIHPGEIVALIGENGAGKSTLMKILGGVHQPSEGELLIEGKPVRIGSVAEATDFGIGFVHQELNNLDNLDIAANVFLGREPRRGFLLNRGAMREATRPYLERLGLNLPPDTLLSELSIGQQQMVEIAKALSMEARILIMDEPTSSLTLGETERLLSVMRAMRRPRDRPARRLEFRTFVARGNQSRRDGPADGRPRRQSYRRPQRWRSESRLCANSQHAHHGLAGSIGIARPCRR